MKKFKVGNSSFSGVADSSFISERKFFVCSPDMQQSDNGIFVAFSKVDDIVWIHFQLC